MARTYHYEATVCLGRDEGSEFDVKASYTVAWGSPEAGRFGPVEGYDPGSADEVENIKVLTIEGLTEGWGERFAFGFQTDAQIAETIIEALTNDHADRMLHEAAEEDDGRRDEAAEYRAEARQEAFEERF